MNVGVCSYVIVICYQKINGMWCHEKYVQVTTEQALDLFVIIILQLVFQTGRLDPDSKRLMKLGTFCSGTDCAVQVVSAFLEACGEVLQIPECDLPVLEHVFSCEKDKQKQTFLRTFCNMTLLHEDALQPLPNGHKKAHIISAGFPCDDASGLHPNSSSDQHRLCVSEDRGRIGGGVG